MDETEEENKTEDIYNLLSTKFDFMKFFYCCHNFLKIPMFPGPKNEVSSKQKTFLIIVITEEIMEYS